MLTIKKKGQDAKNNPQEEIASIMHKAGNVLLPYKKQLLIAASLVVAVLVIAGGYSLMRSSDERKAGPLLNAAYAAYNSTLDSTPDYRKALDLYRDIQKKYSGTGNAAIAQYYIGNCLANLGQTEEALKEYEAFVTNYSGEKFLLGLVYQRMAYLYGMSGRQADAIKAFERAEDLGGPGVATVELARLYEKTGNVPESQKKYKVVQEKLNSTSWGIEAMGKVQMLNRPQPAAGSEGK